MNILNIADNLVRLRHEKKITQEQLADFIGVTKASVSKWETKQTTPDIMLLPQLASFFDISVDELLGYKPQLSKEQIPKIYQELASDFAKYPFEEVMEKSRKLVKQYYSCYPFLFQIAVLWLNHYPLAKKEQQAEILKQISVLCDHIIANCKDMGICSDTVVFKAIINLQLGNAQEVIDTLADILKPERLVNQSDYLLTQAYMLVGDFKKADGFTQLSMYNHLLSLLQNAITQITMPGVSFDLREETISRIQKLLDIYNLEKLHPNFVAQFHYMSALFYAENQNKTKTIYHLQNCSLCIANLLCEKEFTLHGDDYFTMLESQFEELNLQIGAPRNRSLVIEDIKHLYDHPSFAFLADEPEYQRLKNKLMEVQ